MLAPAEQAQAGRGGSVSRRDHNQAYWKRAHSQADPTPKQRPNSIASRSSGGGPGEGKDSHSRQWRLSMAAFLNRNKRPQAAPIEVAELLQRSRLPEYSHATASGGSAREGLLVEKLPPSQTLFTFLLSSADQFLEGVQRVSLLGVEGQGRDQGVAHARPGHSRWHSRRSRG